MALTIDCPSCGRRLSPPLEGWDERVRCPACAKAFNLTADGNAAVIPLDPQEEPQSLVRIEPNNFPPTIRASAAIGEIDGDDRSELGFQTPQVPPIVKDANPKNTPWYYLRTETGRTRWCNVTFLIGAAIPVIYGVGAAIQRRDPTQLGFAAFAPMTGFLFAFATTALASAIVETFAKKPEKHVIEERLEALEEDWLGEHGFWDSDESTMDEAADANNLNLPGRPNDPINPAPASPAETNLRSDS